ncbi:MAG: hypothetical protein ACR2ML_05475 [Solirubrobacteraceae bacterium]
MEGSEKPATNPFALAGNDDYIEASLAQFFSLRQFYSLEQFAFVDAGSGDDRIVGSKFEDTIDLGPGRDKAFGRARKDRFFLDPDGSPDLVRGDGGRDTLSFNGVEKPVTVDMTGGIVTGGGTTDRIAGIERVLGGRGADTLLGSARADALYGEQGVDRIHGRGGNDLLVGEATFADLPPALERFRPPGDASANELFGGEGDDVIYADNDKPAPTSRVDCGPGSDRETGEVDDRVLGCERAAFAFPRAEFFPAEAFFELPASVAIRPVARGADEAPVYDFFCPAIGIGACIGTVKLERPPVPGSKAPAEVLGTGSLSLSGGQRANVAVALTPAGRAAIAAGDPIAVRMAGKLIEAGRAETRSFEFGWQQQSLGGP